MPEKVIAQHVLKCAITISQFQEIAIHFTKYLRSAELSLEELRVGLEQPQALRLVNALIELRDATTAVVNAQADSPQITGLSKEASDQLRASVWPGN